GVPPHTSTPSRLPRWGPRLHPAICFAPPLTRPALDRYFFFESMNKAPARFALVCASVGLAASAAATYVHYHLLYDPHYTSFCDVNATFNCSQVYLSRFGTAFGVPVALLGTIWFALTVVVAAVGLAGPSGVRESIPGYLFAMSTLAL